MKMLTIAVHDFQAALVDCIAVGKLVVITRHDQTIVFIPTGGHAKADIAALKKVWGQLDQMLASQGIDPDGLIADFKAVGTVARKFG